MHSIIRDVWLTRNDEGLEQERAARRKGRPKSTKELKLEDTKLRETEEYRTGMGKIKYHAVPFKSLSNRTLDVPDLTHEATVKLFRKWDQKEVAYIQLLRFIRINGADSTSSIISKPGQHHSLENSVSSETTDEAMVTDRDYSLLTEPPSRFASTIMMMDEGPIS